MTELRLNFMRDLASYYQGNADSNLYKPGGNYLQHLDKWRLFPGCVGGWDNVVAKWIIKLKS